MDHIVICDLEVAYRVGVSEVERAAPQRLLLSLDLEVDFERAVASDHLDHTIDYYAVTRHLLEYGKGRSWRLIEKLAADIAALILTEFPARAVTVEVKKFIISETRYVAVRLRRARKD
jgi:FolB domain-containing protein